MSATFGKIFQVTIFGESHSAGIGIVIDGLPPGFSLDLEAVRQAMKRRAPNKSEASTKRSEKDEFEILCGFHAGKTTGTPLAVVIRNTDTRSQDYMRTANLLRPGHADYTGFVKFHGANDIRGGGHFSGRITAPLVFAGACARQILCAQGITIGTHVAGVAAVSDRRFETFTPDELLDSEGKDFPVLDEEAGRRMRKDIEAARMDLDSLGGTIEFAAVGLPAGLGEPFFDSLESELAHMMFSIPAIKAIEFGDGFAMASGRGSEMNDSPQMDQGTVRFSSNHSGGINGGISNGMPVVFRVAVRPTASISKKQNTIDVNEWKNAELELHGRHDACIVPRACEVVKNAAAVVLLDMMLRWKAQEGSKP